MSSVQVLPQGTYPIGSRTLGPSPVPSSLSRVQLDLDGAAMTDPSLHVTIQLDLSPDVGATWASTATDPANDPFPIGVEFNGGTRDRSGNPIAVYSRGIDIPGVGHAGRLIKAIVTIDGAPLTTTGTLTLT